VMTCPGCGGVLRQYTDDKVIWYQCQVGHRFTSETMMLEQNAVVEEHFWRLLAILKEKQDVAKTMATDTRATIHKVVQPEYFDRQALAAQEAQERINDILDELGPELFPGVPEKDVSEVKRIKGKGSK